MRLEKNETINQESYVIKWFEEFKNQSEWQILRCLTGMRPSWKLHLWHYVWALENRKKMQDLENVKNQFLIADYHVMWEEKDVKKTKENIFEVVKDWLAVWLDPNKSDFVVQSYLPESAELTMFLSMLTPLSKLYNNPTLKEEIKQLDDKWIENNDSWISTAFFNYPVSQAADILLPKANIVPVWEDQLPHIELTRYIARQFNKKFGTNFPLPRALIWEISRLVGTDWKAKMWKSMWNAIMLSDSTEEIRKKVKSMYTDPTRIKASDPWHVEWNVVFMYLDIFLKDVKLLEELKNKYREWKIGDMELKSILTEILDKFISPIREKRLQFEDDRIIWNIIQEGSERARLIAIQTMKELKKCMGILKY